MVATRYATTSGNGRMCSSGDVANSNWLLGHYAQTVDNFYANGTVYGTPGTINDTNWRIYTGTNDSTGNECNFYINNSHLVTNGASNTVGTYAFQIGRNSNGTEYSNGQICFILAYNRILSEAEVLQNYNALKSEVGL